MLRDSTCADGQRGDPVLKYSTRAERLLEQRGCGFTSPSGLPCRRGTSTSGGGSEASQTRRPSRSSRRSRRRTRPALERVSAPTGLCYLATGGGYSDEPRLRFGGGYSDDDVDSWSPPEVGGRCRSSPQGERGASRVSSHEVAWRGVLWGCGWPPLFLLSPPLVPPVGWFGSRFGGVWVPPLSPSGGGVSGPGAGRPPSGPPVGWFGPGSFVYTRRGGTAHRKGSSEAGSSSRSHRHAGRVLRRSSSSRSHRRAGRALHRTCSPSSHRREGRRPRRTSSWPTTARRSRGQWQQKSGAQQHCDRALTTLQARPLERRTVPVRRIVGGGGGWWVRR